MLSGILEGDWEWLGFQGISSIPLAAVGFWGNWPAPGLQCNLLQLKYFSWEWGIPK